MDFGNAAPYRVLIVDDDPDVLATTEAILCDVCEVVTASNGEKAIQLLDAERFDAVCTDYAMTGMTGLDVIRYSSQLPNFIGKILLTARHEIGDGSGYYVLIKPCAPQRLLDVVIRACALSRRRSELKKLR
jgi:DNA-binding NtrC family response regulator